MKTKSNSKQRRPQQDRLVVVGGIHVDVRGDLTDAEVKRWLARVNQLEATDRGRHRHKPRRR